MKKLQIKLLMMVLYCFCTHMYAQKTIKVQIKDKETKESIESAVIKYSKGYSETNKDGIAFVKVDSNDEHIRVLHVGYEEQVFYVDATDTKTNYVFFLKEKAVQLGEVRLVGVLEKTTRNTVTSLISNKDLMKSAAKSLGNMLQKVEGVSTIKSGGTVSKPVIHGLHSNRILLINNGVVHQSQDWGDDHAPEIDPFIANRISVIKGAEGVRYGASALGGVVLLTPKKLPYKDKGIHGNIGSSFATNGYKGTFFSMVEGTVLIPELAWRIQGNKEVSADIYTPDYVLNNTSSNSLNFSGTLGFKKEKYGIETYFSQYRNELGVFFGSHVGSRFGFAEKVKSGRPLETYPANYSIEAPKQDVVHNLLKVEAFFKPFSNGKLKLGYNYQANKRKEYSVRRLDRTKIPSLDMKLITQSLNSSYQMYWSDNWETEIGGSYKIQINENEPGTGVVPIIPNYGNVDVGAFAFQKYKSKTWNFEAGVRYDYRNLNVDGKDRNSIAFKEEKTFRNIVYSLGGAYFYNNWKFTSNVGVAWRAPHVGELYSNGLHHGAIIFKKGDKKLVSEKGIKWINDISYSTPKFQGKLTVFTQFIEDYIYSEPTKQTIDLFSGEDYPVFKYKQDNAFFRGGDLAFSYQFYDDFSYTFKTSVVYANNIDKERFFPFIPSERINQELSWKKINKKTQQEIYFSLAHNYTAKQKRFDESTELTQSTPEAYHLIDINGGISIPVSKMNLGVHVSIENVMDKLYKEYTNRFRYYAHEMGRNIQLKTVIEF